MVIKAKNAPSDERKPNKRFFREMCSVPSRATGAQMREGLSIIIKSI